MCHLGRWVGIIRLNDTYNIKFVNLSMGAIGVIGMDSNIQNIFIEMGLQKAVHKSSTYA